MPKSNEIIGEIVDAFARQGALGAWEALSDDHCIRRGIPDADREAAIGGLSIVFATVVCCVLRDAALVDESVTDEIMRRCIIERRKAWASIVDRRSRN